MTTCSKLHIPINQTSSGERVVRSSWGRDLAAGDWLSCAIGLHLHNFHFMFSNPFLLVNLSIYFKQLSKSIHDEWRRYWSPTRLFTSVCDEPNQWSNHGRSSCKLKTGRMRMAFKWSLRLDSDATPMHTTYILHWLVLTLLNIIHWTLQPFNTRLDGSSTISIRFKWSSAPPTMPRTGFKRFCLSITQTNTQILFMGQCLMPGWSCESLLSPQIVGIRQLQRLAVTVFRLDQSPPNRDLQNLFAWLLTLPGSFVSCNKFPVSIPHTSNTAVDDR